MVAEAEYFSFDTVVTHADSGQCDFHYSVKRKDGDILAFCESLHFPRLSNVDAPHVAAACEAVHLMLGVTYYKLFVPREIRHTYIFSKGKADFWNTMYTEGLGEFYFVNNIDFRGRVNFPYTDTPSKHATGLAQDASTSVRALVLHGGGKDSIVSAELMKEAGVPFDLFTLRGMPIQQAVADAMGKKMIDVGRTIDPHFLELARANAGYNGHVPILAMIIFVAVLYAALNDYRYVVTSNEASANYGNVDYLGMTVNHQIDKGADFEKMIRAYVLSHISPDIEHFSLLRPLHEVAIATLFTEYPQYFEVFSSSNHNFTLQASGAQQRWDVSYSKGKVEFVFALFTALLPRADIEKIFGVNVYELVDKLPIFKQLLGLEGIKPLDCVGSPDEMAYAMYCASERGEYRGDPIMRYFDEEVKSKLDVVKLKKDLMGYGDDTHIPESLRTVIRRACKRHGI